MWNREFKYLLLITIIFTAACIETDIYLPAFTDMMAFFQISEDQIQSVLTWNFVGICLSGPFYGPISDAIGRKKPLMVALGLFLMGSVITLFADDFGFMILGRVLQGLGSGGCFTLGTAIVFDAFPEEKAIQAINKLNSVIPFIMAAAPMLGGYLNQEFGFRSNFLCIAICVLCSFLITLLWYEETLPLPQRKALNVKKLAGEFKQTCLSIPFWQTTLIVSLSFAAYLAFLSGISVLFVIEMGISKGNLPYFQAALLGAWLIANFLFKRVLNVWGMNRVKNMGAVLFMLGGLLFLISTVMTPQNPYMHTLGMAIYAFGINWINGLYFPEGMALFPDSKGITASLLTSARLLVTAAVVGLASFFYNGTIYPISFVVCTVIAAIFLLLIAYERKRPVLSQTIEPTITH